MQERLLVLPNPYTFVDEDGEPQGACPADPGHAAGKRMWVGAKLDPKRTQFLDDYEDRPKVRRGGRDTAWTGDPRPRPQSTKFSFAKDPVDIPSTAHYLDRIREGSLIAANEETYQKVFGGRAQYVEPAQALAEARGMAFDEYKAAHGKDPAFAREEAAALAPEPMTELKEGHVEFAALAEQIKALPPETSAASVPDYERTGVSPADTAPEAPGGTK